jgi:hypothetical protein
MTLGLRVLLLLLLLLLLLRCERARVCHYLRVRDVRPPWSEGRRP